MSLTTWQRQVTSALQRHWARHARPPGYRALARDFGKPVRSILNVFKILTRDKLLVEAQHGLRFEGADDAWPTFTVSLTPSPAPPSAGYSTRPWQVTLRAPRAETAACWATDLWREEQGITNGKLPVHDRKCDESLRCMFTHIEVKMVFDVVPP